jgi:hypothetical protein
MKFESEVEDVNYYLSFPHSTMKHAAVISTAMVSVPCTLACDTKPRTFLEDVCGGARRGLLRSSSLSQESGVVQLALRGT